MRRQTGDDAINASERSRFSALGDALWSAQDRARTGTRHGAESLGWTVRRWLLWPLQDRAETAGTPARALGIGALVLLAAGAGVAALLWAAPNSGNGGEKDFAAWFFRTSWRICSASKSPTTARTMLLGW